jgi:hypothetical protein
MKKKFTSALAATFVAMTLIVAPVAPANAAPGYVVCGWFPVFCR